MSFWEEEHTLTRKLRNYSVKNVKILEADMARTRKLVKDCIEDQVMVYCREKSLLPILRLEYTGSVYEGLKTQAADEVDVMVVLKTTKQEVALEKTVIPGYARLKTTHDSELHKYANPTGYILPERLRNGWFNSLVVQAVNSFNRSSNSDVHLGVRYHGPAIQIDVTKKKTNELLLSTDLVPCFQTGPDDYFVPKSFSFQGFSHSELLWRQSFSLKEKALLRHMDTDSGCRHELLRIVKTIVDKGERPSLGRLTSYHVKTAFMHYIKENPVNWDNYSLGTHFHGFLQRMQTFLEKGSLPHYWLPDINLLEEDFSPSAIDAMGNRLKNILNSEAKLNHILGCEMPPTVPLYAPPLRRNVIPAPRELSEDRYSERNSPVGMYDSFDFRMRQNSWDRIPNQWNSTGNAERRTRNVFWSIAFGLITVILAPVKMLLFVLRLLKKTIIVLLKVLAILLDFLFHLLCFVLLLVVILVHEGNKNQTSTYQNHDELLDSSANETNSQ